jgi:sulfide:quinone oxidoreductase
MARKGLRVVIAGGGVAGLEALLALRALAGDRVELTLVAPQEDFVYRPLAVAEPFGLGSPRRTPLTDAAADTGAAFIRAAVDAVDPQGRTIQTSDHAELPYDALVIATGAGAVPAFTRGLTWDDRSDVEVLQTLTRDLQSGDVRRLAIVIPAGPGWPMPAYELALLTGRRARGVGAEPEIVLVSAEHSPLAVFGPQASREVGAELDAAGVRFETSADTRLDATDPNTVVLHPSGRRFKADRVLALPRLVGNTPRGLPADADGYLPVDEFCRVRGVERVWGAGDGIAFPVKFGGLAAEEADTAAADIAAEAGADVERRPFRPVLRGRLLTGRRERWMRHEPGSGGEGEARTEPLWWPPGKIAGQYLAPWLAARDATAATGDEPGAPGLPVEAAVPAS